MLAISNFWAISILLGIATSAPAPAPAPAVLLDRYATSSPPLTIQEREQEPLPSLNIPTRYESTVLGRRLLAQSSLANIGTVFPHKVSSERVPPQVHDAPINQPEYMATCEGSSGNPTILALKISTSTRNAEAGSNVTLAVDWWSQYVKVTGKEPWSYANLPRLSLIGYLEEIPEADVVSENIVKCFTAKHPDSVWWLPGDKSSPHAGVWMRLVVEQVYWIGGFGDRAYIGWFDPEEWRGVTTEEWSRVRLPGEV